MLVSVISQASGSLSSSTTSAAAATTGMGDYSTRLVWENVLPAKDVVVGVL